MNYALAYRLGFHPWEDAGDQAAFVDRLGELIGSEERGSLPYGRALDIGTGSGIWGVMLARRGWQVTGIDLVERALDRARERVGAAGVDVQLVRGDVTALSAADLGSGFRLVLDTGTFHGLKKNEREAMGRGITEVTAPDATVLLLAWPPRRRGPAPRGVSQEDVQTAFLGWEISDLGPTDYEAPKLIEFLLRPAERWYRLRRP